MADALCNQVPRYLQLTLLEKLHALFTTFCATLADRLHTPAGVLPELSLPRITQKFADPGRCTGAIETEEVGVVETTPALKTHYSTAFLGYGPNWDIYLDAIH
ncbi:Hypothetical predicted protein [Pelobates cultripes]|uniref:Uncharacterized protein n=1 Tax=Pelobates cultripes TaxID=61616 RepID=A0AAD1RUI7_PELCU|nr:Hypothetical predicted protein [Pelobates cultripes]